MPIGDATHGDWTGAIDVLYAFAMDTQQAAIEAEADRLFAVFIRIRLLAQTRSIEFALAGQQAVRDGMVAEADWRLIRQV